MALITCPECKKQVSDKANSCPNCGYPMNLQKAAITSEKYTVILQCVLNNKIEIIKYIDELLKIGIYKSKMLVDNTPSIILKNLSFENANIIKLKLEQLNAKVIIEKYNKDIDDSQITQSHKIDILACPRCGSTAITTGQRGFGLLTGFLGSNKTVNRCGKCGHSWEP